ncbi:MAG: class I SAM-dependent methyltransferase [Candidatus Moranbacteria bacterium]|nr:class I SAM-dependent methyltransferase [Candidatus Moranbacteria bacterium]MDD3964652.1 class I SAM-dependent methyltransferase [Candidatus Moranbacteria bacterium]
MSVVERKRVRNFGVSEIKIHDRKMLLQNEMIKKPIDLTLDREQYIKLYHQYEDADALGYYEKSSPEYIRVKNILSSVKKNSLVYDVGCNSGGIGRLLIKQKQCQVYGSEICPSLGEKASEKGLKVFIGWAEHTPYKEEIFDYAILTFILEHVLDPEMLMKETMRVVKDRGMIIGHVPTASGDWGKKTIGRHPEHLRAYNQRELKKLLKKSGLHDIQITKIFLIGRTVADYYFFLGRK